jgi:parallel beta-helix repeat protein
MPFTGSFSGFTFRGVTVIGNKDVYSSQYAHCIQLAGNISNVLIESSTFKTCEFAVFQNSDATGTVDGFTVHNSIFFHNFASDLEFNAPNSIMKNINVTNTQFSNNNNSGPSAGWAVGLANVHNVLVQNNTITNYKTCGIHVEDRSSNVLINNNQIINAAQQNDNDIFIVSNSTNINVTNNIIDARNNTRDHYIVLATAGGSAPIPTNVLVRGNTLYAGHNTSMWYLQPGNYFAHHYYLKHFQCTPYI